MAKNERKGRGKRVHFHFVVEKLIPCIMRYVLLPRV